MANFPLIVVCLGGVIAAFAVVNALVNISDGASSKQEMAAQVVLSVVALIGAGWLLAWGWMSWGCEPKACRAMFETMQVQFFFGIVGVGFFACLAGAVAWRKTPSGLRPLLLVNGGVLVLLAVVLLR